MTGRNDSYEGRILDSFDHSEHLNSLVLNGKGGRYWPNINIDICPYYMEHNLNTKVTFHTCFKCYLTRCKESHKSCHFCSTFAVN